MLERWFGRTITLIAVLLILVVLVAALLQAVQFGPSKAAGAPVYSVSIEYFGVDAEEMERQITVPLEDAVSALSGIQRLRSISEYGKSIVEATLSADTAPDRFYLALRDAVNSLYASMPKAVQRPQIQSAGSGQRPFFIVTASLQDATLDQTRDLVDKSVKPALEQIDGVGDLEVGGGSQREVHVMVDQKRAASMGLSFNRIASILQSHYLVMPIGRLRTTDANTPIILNGRLDSLRELANLPITLNKNRIVRLGEVADVQYGVREPDAVSRMDGERKVTLYVRSSGSANTVSLSGRIRAKLSELRTERLSFDVVYDLGSDIAGSIGEVLKSLLISAVIVTFFVGSVLRPIRNAVLLALFLPFVVLSSAALLTAFHVSIDNNILAGIAVGIGLIVDPGIIVLSAIVGSHRGGLTAKAKTIGGLVPPLAASLATMVIVLVPLLFMGRTVRGLSEVSYALAMMLVTSLVFALLFLPAFAAERGGTPRGSPILLPISGFLKKAARSARRGMDRVVAWSTSHAAAVLSATAAVSALGVFAALRMDLVLSPPADPRSVYAHVEFASGTSIQAIDSRTAWLASQIRRLPGVTHVETIARRESAEMTVTLSGSREDATFVRSMLTEMGRQVPDSFVYLPEGETGNEQEIEVSLIGPENDVLRSTAKNVAGSLQAAPWARQVVLNFKEGPPTWVLRLNQETASDYGLSAASIAATLRWSMYGPVAMKWFEPDSREIDLRVRSRDEQRNSLHVLSRTPILGSDGRVVSVSELGTFQLTQPPSRIYRADRQRAVYFTVQSGLRSAATFLSVLESSLAAIPLPFGYAFRIDTRVYDRLQQLKNLTVLLIVALALVFIVLAAQTESLSTPLLVMSIVPVSLSVPVSFLWAIRASIDVSVIVSLIIMSGIIVNNAILLTDRTLARLASLGSYGPSEVRRSVRYAVKRRARALLLTSTTTILGVTPFLFGTASGPELFRPLAIVVFWGTLASATATFLVLPAVASAAPVFLRRTLLRR